MKRKITPALSKLATQPVTFLLMDHALVTVHAAHNRTIDAVRNRRRDCKYKPAADVAQGIDAAGVECDGRSIS